MVPFQQITWIIVSLWGYRLISGKNGKVHSWHASVIKYTEKEQLVYQSVIMLGNYNFVNKILEILGNL